MNDQPVDIQLALSSLIGQLVWNAQRGVDTFLTMEFGEPHLSMREPIVPKASVSPRKRRSLQRRRVFVVGDWHLWVQHADWKLKTANGTLSSNHDVGTKRDEMLHDLSGQRLLSIDVIPATRKWTLVFDLGGVLDIWPATYEAEELWGLHGWNGDIVGCRQDGSYFRAKAAQPK